MSQEQNQNKRIVQRLYQEVGNEGRLEVLDEIAWPDHVEHYPLPGQGQGVEGFKQRVSMVRAAFNPTFTIELLIAEGDKVAVMWSNRCEHVGEWFGFRRPGRASPFTAWTSTCCGTAAWPSTGTPWTSPSSWWRSARCPLQPGRRERRDDLGVGAREPQHHTDLAPDEVLSVNDAPDLRACGQST